MSHFVPEPREKRLQEGYILVFVLLVFVIVLAMGIILLQTAFLEKKQSEYGCKWGKAMQSCQAGIEGTMEIVYARLGSQSRLEKLPEQACEAGGPFVFSPDTACSYIIEPDGALLVSASDGSCTYSFICAGRASDAICRIKVTCEFKFDQIYEDDGRGQKLFIKRVLKDRGSIIRSEIIL